MLLLNYGESDQKWHPLIDYKNFSVVLHEPALYEPMLYESMLYEPMLYGSLLYFITQISEMPELFEISVKNIFIFIARVCVMCTILFINVQLAFTVRRSGNDGRKTYG